MELTLPQALIVKDNHRFRVVDIGRRGGKTTAAVEEIRALAYARESRICYLAPTFQQARDIAWEQLKKETLGIAVSVNESRLEIKVRTQDGKTSLIVLRGWEAVETLRGQAFDFLVIDEVASMRNFWLNWQEVLRPTLTDRRGNALFISTPKGFNHFYDLYNMEAKDSDFKSFHFTTYDNPFIPRDEIEKAKQELTEDRFAQEYMADFRKTEGLVFKEFDRTKHLFADEQEMAIDEYERIAGLDWGYTNPAAIPSIVVDMARKYWVVDEYYHSGRTDAEVADFVAGKHFQRVYPDPENAAGNAELRKRGINIRDVNKGKDSVVSGIQVIRELLKSNRLKIHQRCSNLIAELEMYSYPDKKDAHNADELPIKENDHLIDALRYALMMYESTSQSHEAIVSYPAVPSYAPAYHPDANRPIQQNQSPGPYRPTPRF